MRRALLALSVIVMCTTISAQPIAERVLTNDLAWVPLDDVKAGEWFRWEGHTYLRLAPEPLGLASSWPDQSGVHLLYAASEGRILCGRVSGTMDADEGAVGGIITMSGTALVQKVEVQISVIRAK